VGTYLQESLGFLSQQHPSGGWPTGAPAAAGAGKSLGMAFLSGVCAPGGCRGRGVKAGEGMTARSKCVRKVEISIRGIFGIGSRRLTALFFRVEGGNERITTLPSPLLEGQDEPAAC